jgi:hypothetical protein
MTGPMSPNSGKSSKASNGPLHLTNLPESSAVFVAVREDVDIVGVAHIRESVESPGRFTAELDALYVLPSSQGQARSARYSAKECERSPDSSRLAQP